MKVNIGNIPLGDNEPIRIQSMTNTDTLDINKTVEQCKKIFDAGADYVRITAQTIKHAEKLREIKLQLQKAGYNSPLIADIHFNPKVAELAATIIDKVRINPGNYYETKHKDKIEYTDEEQKIALQEIKKRLRPLLEICKENNTAIRIGTNHGSLSQRIMSKYGDTPKGMVEATMEFLRICVDENFPNIVISLKSSNTIVMVQACRLLVQRMRAENMNFPLHLGVTEAGNDNEGRIKSAVGIGALLVDNIGDTIRVSLTESPEKEIPVAKLIVKYSTKQLSDTFKVSDNFFYNRFVYQRRKTNNCLNIGSENVPIVVSNCFDIKDLEYSADKTKPDFFFLQNNNIDTNQEPDFKFIINSENWKGQKNVYPLFNIKNFTKIDNELSELIFISLSYKELDILKNSKNINYSNIVLITKFSTNNFIYELRLFFKYLIENKILIPVVIKADFEHNKIDDLQIQAAINFGVFFIDGFGDGIFINNKEDIKQQEITDIAFNILQATRTRISKTEYISCPGCGRTLFNLEKTVKKIKERTSHLKNLKIGIMGCIVNGPGEMADADYGYVGVGKNKITLYKKQEIVKKNIPELQAVEELIMLIKENGDWIE